MDNDLHFQTTDDMIMLSTFRLLSLGYKRQLKGESLWLLRPQDQTVPIAEGFYQSWLEAAKNK